MTSSEKEKKSTGKDLALTLPKSADIITRMARIMADLGPISKEKVNKGQGYKFRGIEDVYKTVQKLMAREEVICHCENIDVISREKIQNKSGGQGWHIVALYTYRYSAPDGSYILSQALGEGMDYGDKASYKAASGSQKYAIIQPFCIPTEDAINPEDRDEDEAQLVRTVENVFNGAEVHNGNDPAQNQALVSYAASVGFDLDDHQKRVLVKASHGKPVKEVKTKEFIAKVMA